MVARWNGFYARMKKFRYEGAQVCFCIKVIVSNLRLAFQAFETALQVYVNIAYKQYPLSLSVKPLHPGVLNQAEV